MIKRVIAITLLVIAATLAVLEASDWAKQVTSDRARGNDFSASYVAALLLRDGEGTRLYDQTVEVEKHRALEPPNIRLNLPFIAPPTTALLAVPFTSLDPESANRIFSFAQWALVLVAALVAAWKAPWPRDTGMLLPVSVAAVTSVVGGSHLLLLLGQWDGLMALGIAMAYALWKSERPAVAGFVLALSIGFAKPQLGFGIAAFLIARGAQRELLGATAACAVLVISWIAIAGWAAPGSMIHAALATESSTYPLATLGSLGLAASWLGIGSAGHVTALVLAVVGIGLAGGLGWASRHRPQDFEPLLAEALCLSLFAGVHMLGYDLVLLAPAATWTVAWALGQAHRKALIGVGATALALMAGAYVDIGNVDPAPPGRVTPLVLVAAGVAAGRWALRTNE